MSDNGKAPLSARIKGHLMRIFETMFGHGQWKAWLLLPVCLLICLGLYYGAKGISTLRLQSAQRAAERMEAEVREGSGSFYFNTLSGREQHIYDTLDKALSVCSPATALISFVPTASEFQNAAKAVFCDRPQYVGVLFEETEMQTSRYSARISLTYTEDVKERQAALATFAKELLSTLPIDNAYDRALALHDALVKRAVYHDENARMTAGRTDAYDALAGNACDGYAYAAAYAYLCREADIGAEIVLGTANGGEHAWNALYLDEGIGYVDVMWNDTPIKDTILPFHGYFMLSIEEISKDHTFANASLFQNGESANYYEHYGFALPDDEARATEALTALLTRAAEKNASAVELLLPEIYADEAVFKEVLHEALATVSEIEGLPKLRTVNRIYHASDSTLARTVQLFYEE